MLGFEHREGTSRDGTSAHKKTAHKAIGRSRGDRSCKLHLVAADDRNVVTWSLTPAQTGDAPEGRRLIEQLGPHYGRIALLMDSAYQDDAACALTCSLGMVPIVPPNPLRRVPWQYDKCQYRQRDCIERLSRRIKA